MCFVSSLSLSLFLSLCLYCGPAAVRKVDEMWRTMGFRKLLADAGALFLASGSFVGFSFSVYMRVCVVGECGNENEQSDEFRRDGEMIFEIRKDYRGWFLPCLGVNCCTRTKSLAIFNCFFNSSHPAFLNTHGTISIILEKNSR